MAGFALGVNRALLPWKRAGVEYLLCEEEGTVNGLRALCRSAALSPRRPAPSTPAQQTADRPAAPLRQTTPRPSIPPVQAVPAEPYNKNIASAASTRAPVVASNKPEHSLADTKRASGLILPLERWPGPWKTLLEKTARAPLLLWSYPELRDDLSGRSSRERSNALRRLFADLKLPKGSHAFWPFAPLYAPEDFAAQPESVCDGQFFHSGVRALRPRTVLLLCEQLPEALRLPEIGVMQSIIHDGVRFVRLHGVEQLAEDMLRRPARHTQLVQFLRTLCQ